MTQSLARLGRMKEGRSDTAEEIKALRREAIGMDDREAIAELLDHWVRLLPEDEEARELRGDVLYKGPFRRQVASRWYYAKEPRTGEETRIWLTREESEALDADPLYRQALAAADTAVRIGTEGGGRLTTWFYFDDDVAPRPFMVCTRGPTPAFTKDRAASVVRTLARLRRSMLADYADAMKLAPGREAPLIPIYVFSSADDYNEFRKNSSIQGFPDPAQAAGFFTWSEALSPVGWLFVWSKNPEAAYFKEVISHEGTHLLHYQYTNPSAQAWGTRSDGTTTWFQEGLAEYWGGHSIRDVGGVEVFFPGRMLGGRFDHLWRYLPQKAEDIPEQEPRFMPLRDMCRTSYTHYNQEYNLRSAQGDPSAREMVGLFYAQGWAFVHFLMHGAGGRYRPALLRYMRTELEAHFAWRELEKGLGKQGKEGWDELTQEFIDYVRKELRPIRMDMEKTDGYGPWAAEEAARLAKAIQKLEEGEVQ